MIEVLVSLLLLGIVVMGYTGLELLGLNTMTDAHYREQALFIVSEVRERITLNALGQDLYFDASIWSVDEYLETSDSPCKKLSLSTSSDCDFSERARLDVRNIQVLLSEALPESQLLIQPCDSEKPQDYCISITWYGLDPLDCKNSDADSVNQYDCVKIPIRVI